MNIAYLVNQYPQASQSFIRREITALEALGVTIRRFTVRRWDQALVDAGDLAERAKTRAVLDGGKVAAAGRLVAAAVAGFVGRPVKFLAALRLAVRLGGRSDRGRLVHLIYLAEACVLRRWVKRCGAQHVHAHFGTNSAAVALLIRALGGPTYSFTAHGPEEFDKPEALSLGEKIGRAAFVVAVGEFGRSQLFRWCGHRQWDKTHVVRCGVDAAFLRPAPPPGNRRLVCVGRLVEQKGQLVLLRAAALLAARGIAFELTLVGDGPMRGAIEAQIRAQGVEGKVRLVGWMSNDGVRQMIVESRAMVLPSFAEGLPVVLMEAMALGRPVVTTYVAGIPELVSDGACGYLVPAGDAAALAAAMERMLAADDAEVARMGREGAARVGRLHDAAKEAAKLAGHFAAVVDAARQPAAAATPPIPSPGTPGEG